METKKYNPVINKNLSNKAAEIIGRMSNISSLWSIASIHINVIPLSFIFSFKSEFDNSIDCFFLIFFICFIFLMSTSLILISNQYFKLENETRFFQKITSKKINFKKNEFLIGKGFEKLEEKIKSINDEKEKEKLLEEYKTLKKYKFYSLCLIFKKNKYSIWVPLLINFISFLTIFSYTIIKIITIIES